ncbi:MAG: hypothetical protein U9N51_10175 [Bacteroidota bacterium]|nr:hypothetical protein [Bacteroidota bacterium]
MLRIKYIVILLFLFGIISESKAQNLVNYHIESYPVIDSIIQLNNYPVIFGSLRFLNQEEHFNNTNFSLDAINGTIHCKTPESYTTIHLSYRSYRNDISKVNSVFFPQENMLSLSDSNNNSTSQQFHPDDYKNKLSDNSRLNVRGSIARGVNVGNNQNAVLNSNLNMQIDGDLGDGLMVRASISDRNIPIQPDGTSQQLQDFDQVFIEVYNSDFKLTAGDFSIKAPKGKYMKYQRKTQGAMLHFSPLLSNENIKVTSEFAGAAARGKYHRMEFVGKEGNQGPYKLTGANNETWIIILSGSERIFIDGELLTRGQSKDYIIDYNTGELSFTANQLISKDSRIIVEFEYSDRNYNRFMLTTNHEIKTKNSSYYIRYFSDADAKNQPIDQNIDTDKRIFLSEIGDNLDQAMFPDFDSVGFDNGQIQYRMTDTIINGETYDSIFIYSVNPAEAIYQVGFSQVGQNQGNYIKQINSANGRVYQWVAPENNIPQGNYEPVTLLVTPKKQQMLTLGGENKLGKNTSVYYEVALSNEDKNMYSNLDSQDNQGLALSSGINQTIIKKQNTSLNLNLEYNFIGNNFQSIENFREQEFKRNWNLNENLPNQNEHHSHVGFLFNQKDILKAELNSSTIIRPGIYEGYKQNFQSQYKTNHWDIIGQFNLLNTNRTSDQSQFLKHRLRIGKHFNAIAFYVEEAQEWNQWEATDSLLGESFQFQEIKSWIQQGRKSENQFKLFYKYRLDELPYQNSFSPFSESHDIKASANFISNKRSQLDASIGYRKLLLLNHEIQTNEKAQNNLTAQLRFNQTAWNGFLTTRIFYESGAGLELKKEFTYIEVPTGQGVYTWSDYNGNGVEDLDEFEIAQFTDEAKYIRIYTPGTASVQTFNNQFSMSIQLKPDAIFTEENTAFLQRFYNQFSLNLSNKNTASQWYEQYTPLSSLLADSSLVNLNNSIRNTLSFNRFNRYFSMDVIYHQNQSNILMINGLDVQSNQTTEIRSKIRLFKNILLETRAGIGQNILDSEFFSSKNYLIKYEQTEINLSYQPDMNMRFSILGNFKHKENKITPVFSRQISPALQYRNNAFINGMLSVKITYTYLIYNGKSNSSLAYQMLEALKPGHNMIYSINFQKRLANGLQINLNYQGRKPADSKYIHTGGVQVRAYF